MQTKKEADVPRAPTPHKITFFNFPNQVWSHSAVQAGEQYLSAHTSTHFNPPIQSEFSDPDDTATKILELWRNVIKPMFFSDMVFGNMAEETSKYEYSSVEIPVTEEQFQNAQNLIDTQKSQARNGSLKYSILRYFGKSCGESAQTILDGITKNTAEAVLSKRRLFEWFVVWPQATFERAELVSVSRQQSHNLVTNGLFAPPKYTTDPAQEDRENIFLRHATLFL